MYKQIKDQNGNVRTDCIEKLDTKTYIPFDPDNTDYQAFLLWKSEGNTPQPADEVTQ